MTSSGLEVVARRTFAELRQDVDTLLIAGGRGVHEALADRALLACLRRLAPRVRRLASVCTGAFVLAEAGLLDGRRVTTHWSAAARLAARYPGVTVDADPIFIREGRLATSAGVTAGMDLALSFVEEDQGVQVARAVARELVLFLQRPGGQSQFSAQLEVQFGDRAPIAELVAWMADHLRADQSVPALAKRAGMSPRHFARIFAKETGATPARFVDRLRVEAARRRLEESGDGVDAIADACGLGTAESMRRAFLRTLRVSPSAYRSRFAAPSAPVPRRT
jgi:transcriptional regulator GlxA family with amidase domain